MQRKISPATFLFAFAGILFLLAGKLVPGLIFDARVNATYFVFPFRQISLFSGMTFILFTFLYFIFDVIGKPLKKITGIIHYAISLVALFVIISAPLFFRNIPKVAGSNDPLSASMHSMNMVITISVYLFCAAQLLFLINVILSVRKKKKI